MNTILDLRVSRKSYISLDIWVINEASKFLLLICLGDMQGGLKKFPKEKMPQLHSRMLALAAHALADVSFEYDLKNAFSMLIIFAKYLY